MSAATGIPSVQGTPKRRSRLAEFIIRLVKEKPLGTACGIIIFLLVFVAIFGGLLAPYPYWEVHPWDKLQGSSTRYLMGTDHLGRDLLSRLMYGARISLLVGLAVTIISVGLSTLIGGISGFLGGKFDLLLQRFCDAWDTFPGSAHVVNRNVHSGAGCATDNTGPGDIRRPRRLKSNQGSDYEYKTE